MKIILILLTITTIILSCVSGESDNSTVEIDDIIAEAENALEQNENISISKDITAEEFQSLIDNNTGIILDVRTADEYNTGALNGALNIDYYADDFAEQLDDLDKTTPIYVYCKSGGRSGKTKKILAEKGFKEIYNLIGGYSSWPY